MATRKTATKKVAKKSASKKAPAKKAAKRTYKRKPKVAEDLTASETGPIYDNVTEASGGEEPSFDGRDAMIRAQSEMISQLVDLTNKPIHVQLSARGNTVYLDLAHFHEAKHAFGIALLAHILGVDGYVLRDLGPSGEDLNAGTPVALLQILGTKVLKLNTVNKSLHPADERQLPEGTELLRIDGDFEYNSPFVSNKVRTVQRSITVDGVTFRR